MSDPLQPTLPPGFERGSYQGPSIIGDITEALHAWLLSGWDDPRSPRPKIEEDLSSVPADRQQVIYTYMYRVARNDALKNAKRWAQSSVELSDRVVSGNDMLYERPPVHLFLFYFVAVHARFRSEAERLLGWVMLRLNE
ncbi:MAG: Pvc16 family protein, partial [Myxococcota bacterium]